MDKLEKVIQAFENCTAPEMNDDDDETCVDCIRAGECPWDDCQERDRKLIDIPLSLAMAALELLKAQGPRPMTAEELENALDTVVWIETKDLQENSSSQYAILESYSRKYGYFYLLHLRNEHPSAYPYTKINKTWRPWNIRPTEEQRKAVKWK